MRNTRDVRYSSNPGEPGSGELAGRRGNIGALEAKGSIGPKLLMRLDPSIGRHFIGPLEDGVGRLWG
jgi:hypothetical protein